MSTSKFMSITPVQLDDYLERRDVKEYLLIDVRQPREYEEGHLPGAKLIPIMHLVPTLFDLPRERDLIFYCRNDGRAMAAATLVVEEHITQNPVYHLDGGIMAYHGRLCTDKPRLDIFTADNNLPVQLETAMNLEKGARRFFTFLTRRFNAHTCAPLFAELSRSEQKHARSIHTVWSRLTGKTSVFEEYFELLRGEILEGGNDLMQIKQRAASLDHNSCMPLLELALEIEYSAFDLYRNLAEAQEESDVKQLFWELAQAEKEHIKRLSSAIN